MIHDLKNSIDRTGQALLTLFNDNNEWLSLGNIENMAIRKGRLVLKWPMTTVSHGSSFTKAMITHKNKVLWTDQIEPTRADMSQKVFRLEFDYE